MTKHREGLAMLEMLIAIGLGLVILLPLSSLLSTSLLFHSKQEDIFVMEQDGYRLLDLIEQALLQAGQVHPLQFEQDAFGADGTGGTFGALSGLDNAIISGTSNAMEGKKISGFHGSDALAVHFAASETEEKTDIVNCAGNSVSSFATDNQDRRWSIFYLVPGGNGSGDLRCKYRGTDQWDTQSLASRVVGLQFLYGLDTDDDGLPNQFINATAVKQKKIEAKENNITKQNAIVAIHIALVMQTETELLGISSPDAIDLFGSFYSEAQGSHDPEVHLVLKDFPANQKKHMYRLFERIVFLRNHGALKDQSHALIRVPVN